MHSSRCYSTHPQRKSGDPIQFTQKIVDTLIEQVRAAMPKLVVMHLTVLLSVVDHYNRIAKDNKKRVVGVLLGEYGGRGDFDEDLFEPSVSFFDHIYHENMYKMMRKINSKESIIGWYSSGPAIKKANIEINEIFRKYNSNAVFVLIKVHDAAAPGILLRHTAQRKRLMIMET